MSRSLLLPFAFLEVQGLLRRGRLEEARQAGRRLLAIYPWLPEVWVHLAWTAAYHAPAGKEVEGVLTAESWLELGSRVLPRDPDLPAMAGFLLQDRLPPGAAAAAWRAARGEEPELAADRWLGEAARRAPGHGPILARRSGLALRLAGQALARGDRLAFRERLARVREIEEELGQRGSPTAREWLQVVMGLPDLPSPPWPKEIREPLAATAAGRIFLGGVDPAEEE